MIPNLIARLGYDGSAFTRGIAGAKAQVASLSKAFNAAATSKIGFAAIGIGIGAFTAKTVEAAGHIADLHGKTGLAVSDIEALDYAAKMSGANIDTVSGAMVKMQASMADAAGGNADKLAAFAKFGITLEDIKTKRPIDLFKQIAEAVGTMGNDASVTDAMLQTMGKSAMELAPMMRDGFAESLETFEKLKLGMGPETIAILDGLGDKFTTLAATLTKTLGPAIAWVTDKLQLMIDAFRYTLGGVAAFYGALSAGASVNEARKIALEMTKPIVNEAVQRDMEMAAKAKELNTTRQDAMGDAITEKDKEKFKAVQTKINADSLAKIGGFGAGTDRVPAMERTLERIANATEGTKEALEDGL